MTAANHCAFLVQEPAYLDKLQHNVNKLGIHPFEFV